MDDVHVFILDDRQIVSSHIDGGRLYSAVCEQIQHPILGVYLAQRFESATDPFVYLAQLGQAKHLQLMLVESLDDVMLQLFFVLRPISWRAL